MNAVAMFKRCAEHQPESETASPVIKRCAEHQPESETASPVNTYLSPVEPWRAQETLTEFNPEDY